ncbi:TPA: hypothetical protein OB858_001449 [Escherichia coli]|nr:hypothetical protein [Escherichia coli]EFA8807292.1 hypothetical protein [Escherichia coli O8:H49]EFB4048485.1 hypothetical protein [Escherichia coli]EFD4984039.1 hypothetical protein [Escherichia coli]EFD7782923.1 hypothetical protein [Escherichia coli]
MLIVWAADHYISDTNKFTYIFNKGIKVVSEGYIVTFGVLSDKAETGYGYIRSGDKIGSNLYKIDSFVEKNSIEKATHYLLKGLIYVTV